jgi:type IV pilus assembly protein PilW
MRTLISPSRARQIKLNKQQGLSLVELMVAMTIGLFILAAIGLVYMTSSNSFKYANSTIRMSEDSSFAIDMLSRDVRMAAYGGCAGTQVERAAGADTSLYTADDTFTYAVSNPATVPITTATSRPHLFNVTGLTDTHDKPNPFDTKQLTGNNAISGYIGTDTASDTARTNINAGTSTLTISTTAPILYVAGGSDRALQVNAGVAAGTSTINFGSDPLKWANDITASKPLPYRIISDCKGSEVFRFSGMTAAGVMTTDKPLINAYGTDAVVTPLVSSTYFLATRKIGTVSATTASLYRRYFNGISATVEELIPNIDAINFQYGVNTTLQTAGPNIGQPTYQVDAYQTADNVADWSRVISVRIGFVMVSDDTNLTAGADNTVSWNGGTFTPTNTTDHRLRRAYSTVVSIRNRMGV